MHDDRWGSCGSSGLARRGSSTASVGSRSAGAGADGCGQPRSRRLPRPGRRPPRTVGADYEAGNRFDAFAGGIVASVDINRSTATATRSCSGLALHSDTMIAPRRSREPEATRGSMARRALISIQAESKAAASIASCSGSAAASDRNGIRAQTHAPPQKKSPAGAWRSAGQLARGRVQRPNAERALMVPLKAAGAPAGASGRPGSSGSPAPTPAPH